MIVWWSRGDLNPFFDVAVNGQCWLTPLKSARAAGPSEALAANGGKWFRHFFDYFSASSFASPSKISLSGEKISGDLSASFTIQSANFSL